MHGLRRRCYPAAGREVTGVKRTTIALLSGAALIAVGCGANPGAEEPAPIVDALEAGGESDG